MRTPGQPQWYGRRRGHKLNPGRQRLIDTLLPQLRVPVAAAGGAADEGIEFDALFGRAMADVWLEIGFGDGAHLAAVAARHPHTGMIGCDPFINGVASLLARIVEEDVSNIRIFDDDARQILDHLPAAGIGKVFLLFPDPWPKKRHNRRRFINTATLDALARVMADGAELLFATDHRENARSTLAHGRRHPAFEWTARGAADWRRPPTDWLQTRYEHKGRAKGDEPIYLRFRRVTRNSL